MREYRTIDDFWWFIKGSSIIDRTDNAFCVFKENAFSNPSGHCIISAKDNTYKVGKYLRADSSFYVLTEEPMYYK